MRTTKLTLITLFIVNSINAQHNFELFVEMGIDPKMALEGPYKGKVNDPERGTFNYEAKAGWDFKNQRMGF